MKEEHAEDAGAYHVLVVSGPAITAEDTSALASRLERAYRSIETLAKQEDRVVISTTQMCAPVGVDHMCYTISIHWLKRAEVERLRMEQQLMNGIRGGGAGRT